MILKIRSRFCKLCRHNDAISRYFIVNGFERPAGPGVQKNQNPAPWGPWSGENILGWFVYFTVSATALEVTELLPLFTMHRNW